MWSPPAHPTVISRLPHATSLSEWHAPPPTGQYPSTSGAYADPHLAVLLVLLGFCLLYALLILVDAVVPARNGGEESPSERR